MDVHHEDEDMRARFDAYVADEGKVEPKDWMPDGLSQDAGSSNFSTRPF